MFQASFYTGDPSSYNVSPPLANSEIPASKAAPFAKFEQF
jgi:hypothetical protein